jgi:hypothetical protein
MSKKFIILFWVIVLILAVVVGLRFLSPEDDWICANNEWVKHGQPESPQPTTGCGTETWVQKTASGQTDLIKVTNLQPNQKISSPLTIKGEARGQWFFEASFPVVLVDWDGRIIAEGIAQAKGDWMTTEFVPFEAVLNFTIDKDIYSRNGAIILRKDNPSGLPEHDDALEIPVVFNK